MRIQDKDKKSRGPHAKRGVIALVFGAFDGLHPGHLDFFRQAKRYASYLIVSVGTDRNVTKIKGKEPLFNQQERLELVKWIRLVDRVVLGAERDFYKEIKKYNPDVICLGYDQWASEVDVKKELEKVGLFKTKVIRLKSYKVERAKSTVVKTKSVDF